MSALADLIDDWEPRLRDAFLEGVRRIRSEAEIGLIVSKLERGDIPGALDAVGIDAVQFRALDAALAAAYEAGGTYQTGALPALRVPDRPTLKIAFDVRNPRAEAYLRDRSSGLIREIVEDQREAVRAALVRGMERGANPRDVALDIVGRVAPGTKERRGGLVGLTSQQEAWVASFEEGLRSLDPDVLDKKLRDKRFDRTIAAAIKDNKPLTSEQVRSMVSAYKARALRYRAETIGRTEALRSVNAGAMEGAEQAIEKGQLIEAATTKVWVSTRDGRTRDTHRAMNGQRVPFRAAFVSPSGARLRHPGDPNAPASETIQCRCTFVVRQNYFAGLE